MPGNLRLLEGAERSGLVEMHGGALAFRHELSRRAVEAAMPGRVCGCRPTLGCPPRC